MKEALLERFVRYARIGTQAVPGSSSFPSSPGQLELQRVLAEDLRAAGLQDVAIDEHGYLTATVPATDADADAPTIGWIAHVDTSPDAPGDGVEPIVHRAYDGGRLRLPRGGTVLDPDAMPQLRDVIGHDLVTSSGDTLLGADDKAGVAAIVTAAAELVATGAPRPRVRVCFTPDEEIGLGASRFDVEGFGAVCAYTVDGSEPPVLSDETFHAVELRLVVTGHDVHPGFATGVLVHAGRMAARVVAALPDDLTPERTGGRDGFVHVTQAELTAARAEVRMIVRDFDADRLAEHVALVRRIAAEHVPEQRLAIEEHFQYPNMRRFVDAFPQVTDAAEAAYRAVGLAPVREPIRGGTDGSGLSARGLPTPNLFDGGREFHSVREWASLDDMALAARALVALAGVWTQEPFRSSVAKR